MGRTEFVAWYNGHPDFQDLEFDLSHERAVVVGNGNVALDVARMLALTPEELAPTDTTDAAIEAIDEAGIREILVVGRRGPVQAAWTPSSSASSASSPVRTWSSTRHELELDPASAAELEAAPPTRPGGTSRPARLRAARAGRGSRGRSASASSCRRSRSSATGGSRRVEIVRNRARSSAVVRVATEERETVECGIVFRSVGYRGVAIPKSRSTSARGTCRTTEGACSGPSGERMPGLYCAGWIKRGPSGVIGTNKKDATETVELLLEDARAGVLPARVGGGSRAAPRRARGRARPLCGLGGDRR